MENEVTLIIKKDIISLAGYDYGKEVYNTQLKNKIDLSKKFTIIIPSNIKFVASSFVQGLFYEIKNEIGLLATEERTIIKSENKMIKRKFMSNLG